MLLSDFKLIEGNHFVAMEYYGLILNRTLLVLLTETHVIGVLANGPVSVQSHHDPLLSLITESLSIRGDLGNPLSYVKDKYLRRVSGVDLSGAAFLKMNRANFRIAFNEVNAVSYNPRKKWGMCYYPHDGKVYVTANGKKREFIILGNQSGKAIATWIGERSRIPISGTF